MRSISIILLFLLFASRCLLAQTNHVINSSFEDFTDYPTGFDDMSLCKGWHSYTKGTPDYFLERPQARPGTISLMGVPRNVVGYQRPAHGNAYAGLLTTTDYGTYWREYIAGNIIPLVPGKTYDVSMSVSLADTSVYTTDGLGVFFMNSPWPSPNTEGALKLKPQIDYSDAPVTNKQGWVRLTKSFVADSSYNHIIIGAFKDSAAIRRIPVGDTTGIAPDWRFCYYYIDLITVREAKVDDGPLVVFPNPAGSTVSIRWNMERPMTPVYVCLYTATGQLVRQYLVEKAQPENKLDLTGIAAAMYYIQIMTTTGSHIYHGALAVDRW
jgi:hypothetical protein